jgi:hypothetical protein
VVELPLKEETIQTETTTSHPVAVVTEAVTTIVAEEEEVEALEEQEETNATIADLPPLHLAAAGVTLTWTPLEQQVILKVEDEDPTVEEGDMEGITVAAVAVVAMEAVVMEVVAHVSTSVDFMVK